MAPFRVGEEKGNEVEGDGRRAERMIEKGCG